MTSNPKIILLFIAFLSCIGCKVNYSLSGASISPDVKTINIKYFTKTATLGPPSLSNQFTEKLKDKFLTQTKLIITQQNADITLEGSITAYAITPQAIQANEAAARNRLTISVAVNYTNLKDEKQNFQSTFTRYTEYDSNKNLGSIEEELINEINDLLVDDIFNRAVINW
jgi:hypothetical protein